MIYLILSVIFSTITVSFFKIFERKGVDTLQGIVFNYVTCAVLGSIIIGQDIVTVKVWQMPWYSYALLLGLFFMCIFIAIAQTAQKMGVSVSMVAAKLSVVVPVIAAVILYNESVGVVKVLGILLSLVSVYLISQKESEKTYKTKHLILLPAIVFLGSGVIDTLLNFLEQSFIPPYTAELIVTTAFANAFLFGLVYLLFLVATKKATITLKNVLWGIALGIPNYFSMFFLVKTLGQFDGSYIFPINNIGIVAASTVVGVGAFKEFLTKQNWAGFILAIVSILIISLS